MEKNYEIVIRQCLSYAYTKLKIKEHSAKYIECSNCLHFIFKLNDLNKIEFKIKTFEKFDNTLQDLDDNNLYNLFRRRLDKIIHIRKTIYEMEKGITELHKINEDLCNKLNYNNEKIVNLENNIFHFKELEKGIMYE